MRLNGKNYYLAFLKGKSFEPKGDFDATAIYQSTSQIVDCVFYNGTSYYCKKTTTAGILPTNTEYWGVLASEGKQGERGLQGEQGIQGLQGEKGEKGDKGDTQDISGKAEKDASNLTSENVESWRDKFRKDWTTLYNTGITSTGNYTLADSLSKFDTICIMGYYIASGKYYYVTTILPVWQFKVISEGVLITFDGRFASVGCVNDTTIKVAEISNMYILRIFGK